MVAPKLFELYMVCLQLGDCADDRPCIVISPPVGGRVTVAPISAALDLYNPANHFRIESDLVEFESSGLDRTSYVLGNELREIDCADLDVHLGELTGSQLKKFVDWIG